MFSVTGNIIIILNLVFYGIGGKRIDGWSDGKQSVPPTDTRNTKGVKTRIFLHSSHKVLLGLFQVFEKKSVVAGRLLFTLTQVSTPYFS